VAHALADMPCRPRDLRTLAPDAAKILQGNVYGWFERIERGLYGLTSSGRVALVTWADHVSAEASPGFVGGPKSRMVWERKRARAPEAAATERDEGAHPANGAQAWAASEAASA
jgi:hypothetical protein